MSRSNSKSSVASSQALEPEFLVKTLQNNELIRRLKVVTETLEAYTDEDEEIERAKREVEHLADALGSDWLMQHKNKDVRLLVACALADVLRIYAPDPPYTEETNAAVIRLFLKILRGFEGSEMNPQHPSYSIHFYLLERLNVISIFSIINELVHNRDDLLRELAQAAYSIVGSMPAHSSVPKVTEHLTAILCCVIEEMESYDMNLFDLVVGALCKNDKKDNPAGWNMMKTVIASCENHLQPFIERQIHQVKAGQHPESDLANGERLSEAVYELSTIAPRVLTQVLPAYAEDLILEDPSARIKAVKLLGAVFSVGNFYKDFSYVFAEFKRRSLDKDPDVRKAMVNVVGILLQKRPELCKSLLEDPLQFQGEQRDAPMFNLIVDHDERVRKEAVESAMELCLHNSDAVPLTFLQHVAERAMDRKPVVRQQAIEGLCKLYQKYCAPFEKSVLNETVAEKFGWIANRIVTLYRTADQEIKVFIVRCMEDICFKVSSDRSPALIAADFYSNLDDKGQEAFVTILRSKGKVQEAFLKLSELRQQSAKADLDESTDKDEASSFAKVSQAFAEPAKAQDMLRKLFEVKVQKVWEPLVDLIRKPKSVKDVQKILDDILKRLGPKNALIEFVNQLVWCISDRFFGLDFVRIVLQSLADRDNEALATSRDGLPLLPVLAELQPALFASYQKEIKSILVGSCEDEEVAAHIVQVVAYAADELDNFNDDAKLMKALNGLCFKESAEVAKFSSRALIKISGEDSLECKSLAKSCLSALDFGPTLPAVLAVLSEIAKSAPTLLKAADQNNAVKFAKRVLHQAWPASGKKDKKLVLNTRRLAVKFLCSLILGCEQDGKVDAQDVTKCREWISELEDVLSKKGSLSAETCPDAEKAALRLAAGSCVLKISKQNRLRELLVTPSLFFRTALLCEDEDLAVRRAFVRKIWKGTGLQQGKLPFHFTAMVVLGAHESDHAQHENVKNVLRNILVLMKKLRNISGKILATIAPERILPWVVYLLANHPSFLDPEEDDAQVSVAIKKYLELFFNTLTQAGTDEKIFPMLWLTLEHIKGCSVPESAIVDDGGDLVGRNIVITAEVGKRLVAKFGGQKKWDSDVLRDHLGKIVDPAIFCRSEKLKHYQPAIPDDLVASPNRSKNTSFNVTPAASAQKAKDDKKAEAAGRKPPAARKKLVPDNGGDDAEDEGQAAPSRNMPSRGSKSAMRSLAEESEGEDNASEEEAEQPKTTRGGRAANRSAKESSPAKAPKPKDVEESPAKAKTPVPDRSQRRSAAPATPAESPAPKTPQRRPAAAAAGAAAAQRLPVEPSPAKSRQSIASPAAPSPAPPARARPSTAASPPAAPEWHSPSPAARSARGPGAAKARASAGAAQPAAASPPAKADKAGKAANKRARDDADGKEGPDSDSKSSARVTPLASAGKQGGGGGGGSSSSKGGAQRKSASSAKGSAAGRRSTDEFDFDLDDDGPAPPAAKKAKPSPSPQPSQPSKSPAAASSKGPAAAKSPSPAAGKAAPAKGRASASHEHDALASLNRHEASKAAKAAAAKPAGKSPAPPSPAGSGKKAAAAAAPPAEAPRAKRRRL